MRRGLSRCAEELEDDQQQQLLMRAPILVSIVLVVIIFFAFELELIRLRRGARTLFVFCGSAVGKIFGICLCR